LGELTIEVGLFSVLSVWRERSARGRQTVHEERVLPVFFVFFLSFAFDLSWL
jgi:hypothetical protein